MKKLFISVITIAVIALFWSCSKSSDSSQPGRLIIKVTDSPFPVDTIEYANVTITKVEVRKTGDGISDGNPFIVISEEPVTFNLLELRNGLVEKLADIEIPQGSYDLIRLYVDEASLKVKEGEIFNVKVPSGQQTGIKIFIRPEITVEGGVTSELLLDFDLSRSFMLRGSFANQSGIEGFIFKPVIRVTNMSTAGRIQGVVSDTTEAKVENAEIWIKQDTVISTAYSDVDGNYAFIGVPAGTYSIYATGVNYDTVYYEGVEVIEGNRTIRDFILSGK